MQNGVFLGNPLSGGMLSKITAWDAWLYDGTRRTPLLIDFLAHNSWASARSSMASIPKWKEVRDARPETRLALAVPLITSERPGKPGFDEVLSGAQDARIADMAQVMIRFGFADAYIRLGWEMNGNWYPWNAAQDALGYVASFRRTVKIWRDQPGADFSFVWNPNIRREQIGWIDCYPGDLHVDQIGIDIYDEWFTEEDRWAQALEGEFGLNAMAAYARMAGKPLCVPEWGVGRPEGPPAYGGGTEHPSWVHGLFGWMRDNDVSWHGYWNSDSGTPAHIEPPDVRPRTAAAYRAWVYQE